MKENLEEETISLEKVRTKIEDEIYRIEKEEKKKNLERGDTLVKNKDSKIENYINNIKSFYSNPYFGVVELIDEEKNLLEVYVGKRDLILNGDKIVHDWRSKQGQTYYQETKRSIVLLNSNYKVNRKRILNIDEGELLAIEDLESNDYLENQEIYIDMIERKRRLNVLGNNISTLNSEQIEVIKKPINSDFIVQGYSGTGKTSLILHRLSYLKYNNLDYDFGRVKVLMPNKNIIKAIRDLSIELKIEDIDFLSKKEYYLEILNRYDSIRWKKNIDVLEDIDLDQEFLKVLYSEQFIEECNVKYMDYMKELNEILKIDIIKKISLNRVNRRIDLNRIIDKDSMTEYILFLDSLLKENENKLSRLEELDYKISSIDKDLDFINKDLDVDREELELNKKEEIVKRIYDDRKLKKILEKVDIKTDKDIDYASKGYFTDLMDRIKIKGSDLSNYNKINENMQKKEKEKEKVREFYNGELSVYAEIRNRNNRKLIELEREYENTSMLNFMKKSNLKSQIELIKSEIKKDKGKVESKIYELLSVEKEIDSLYQSENKEVLTDEDLNYIRFLEEDYGKIYDEIDIIKKQIMFHKENIKGNKQQGGIQRERFSNYKEEYNILKSELLNKEERDIVSNELNLLKSNTSTFIYNNTYGPILEELLNRYNIDDSNTYYFNLYFYINFYIKYIGRAPFTDKFINVDDGQDFSLAEYNMLRKVNGNDVVFNIYGDTKKTRSSIGIENWSKLLDISDIYILRKNYRNGDKILKYCNEQLDMNLNSMGLSSLDINFISRDELNAMMEGHKDSNERVGIISNSEDYIYKNSYDIDSSKGLEFDILYVDIKNMSNQDKYIAYTKALNELIIISE